MWMSSRRRVRTRRWRWPGTGHAPRHGAAPCGERRRRRARPAALRGGARLRGSHVRTPVRRHAGVRTRSVGHRARAPPRLAPRACARRRAGVVRPRSGSRAARERERRARAGGANRGQAVVALVNVRPTLSAPGELVPVQLVKVRQEGEGDANSSNLGHGSLRFRYPMEASILALRDRLGSGADHPITFSRHAPSRRRWR